MNRRCYYCGKEATKIIKWKYESVFACTECSQKTAGKVQELGRGDQDE